MRVAVYYEVPTAPIFDMFESIVESCSSNKNEEKETKTGLAKNKLFIC